MTPTERNRIPCRTQQGVWCQVCRRWIFHPRLHATHGCTHRRVQ